jgi:hypothetical protein
MATEQILIDLQFDTSQLESAIDELVRLNVVDEKLAAAFKKSTAEVNAQNTALKNVGNATAGTAKSLDAVATAAKNVSGSFAESFQKGVISSLMEAGLSLEDFEQHLSVLNNSDPAFASLSKSLLEAIEKIKETGAALEALESSGQQGTEAFAKLEQQVNEDLASLQKMTAQMGALKKATNLGTSNASFVQLTKSLKDATLRVNETTAALAKLKASGGLGTEAFAKLQQQLIADEQELKNINAELDKIEDHEGATLPPIIPEGTSEKVKSVKTELKELRAEIAQAIATNQNFGESFEALVARAGKLDDAMKDTAQTIQRTGSDTRVFDGLIEGAQGIAGGFAVAQGTAALFGDESEALQKTLLKVNAAMAILQGLQSLQNVLQKESALSLLVLNAQQKINNAQIALSTALESKNIVVRGAAVIAQRALNLVMAANPIGIVAVALAGLITLLATYGRSAAAAARETSNLNVALGEGQEAVQRRADAAKLTGDAIIKQLQTEGAVQSKITQQELENEKKQAELEKENLESLRALKAKSTDADLEQRQALDKKISELEDAQLTRQIENNNREAELRKVQTQETIASRVASIEAELALAREGSAKQLALQKQLIQARAQQEAAADGLVEGQRQKILAEAQKATLEAQKTYNRAQIEQQIKDTETKLQVVKNGSKQELELQIKLAQQRATLQNVDALTDVDRKKIATDLETEITEIKAAAAKAQLDVKIASVQNELNVVKQGSKEELRLQQELVRLESESSLTNTKLSQEQKENIIKESNDRQIQLGKEFNEKIKAQAIEDAISVNNAELQELNITAERKLNIQIENIDLAARQEIAAAQGNTAKIIEINANRDAQIRDAKIRFQDEALQNELDSLQIGQNLRRGELQTILNDEKQNVADRIAARSELLDFDLELIDAELRNLAIKHSTMRISEEKFQKEYAALLAKRADAEAAAATDAKGIIKEGLARKIELYLDYARQIGDVLQSIGQVQTDQALNRIDAERQALDEAKESGSITEKEAVARAKRIDAEERKIKTDAAKRDKAFAIFNAIINTAAAIVKALATGGPILAALAAAIGAAQIAVIAAKPIPKFRTGKRPETNPTHRYEGIAEVAEEGPEIVERGGTRFLVKEPSLTWLGAKDVVYTALETRNIINKPQHIVNKRVMNIEKTTTENIQMKEAVKAIQKVEKAISKLPIHTISFDENGFQHSQQEGLSRIHYNEKRYRFK